MVERTTGNNASETEIIIRPNGSLSWRCCKGAFAVIAAFATGITLYFVSKGAWLVLPFMGLEMLVLGVALYLSARWSQHREQITVSGDEVVVRQGVNRPREHRLQRHWARVVVQGSGHPWYPSRLLLRAHGRHVEIGARLVESERERLAKTLGELIAGTTAAQMDAGGPVAAAPGSGGI